MRAPIVCVILVILRNTVPVSGKGGGKKGGDKDGPEYFKCNLRLEYWHRYANGTELPVQLTAIAQLRGQFFFGVSYPLFIERLYGSIIFEQQRVNGPVRIKGDVHGLLPFQITGFHILENGRFACNLKSGKHYNPTKSEHGAAKDCVRHIGDLETVTADANGHLQFEQWDPRVQLQGPSSIIGRTVALLVSPQDTEHENETRIACGVVGYKIKTRFDQQSFIGLQRPEDEQVPAFIWYLTILMGFLSLYICMREAMERRSKTQKIKNANVAYFHRRRVQRIRQRRGTSFTNF